MKKITPDFKGFVLKRDRYRCFRCGSYHKNGRQMLAYTLDPGSADTDDYKAMCRNCETDLLKVKPKNWRDVKESRDYLGVSIPRYSAEEVAAAAAKKQEVIIRPDWHVWVYGNAKNPKS